MFSLFSFLDGVFLGMTFFFLEGLFAFAEAKKLLIILSQSFWDNVVSRLIIEKLRFSKRTCI